MDSVGSIDGMFSGGQTELLAFEVTVHYVETILMFVNAVFKALRETV